MNERLEQLMYNSGLTAQGCWDELDEYTKQSIERFANNLIKEFIGLIGDAEISYCHLGEYKWVLAMRDFKAIVKEHFKENHER